MKFAPLALVAALALKAGLALCAATGIDRAGFDPAVRPQDDLFGAANGGWAASTPIPADKPEFGVAIQLRDASDERVRRIVEELAATPHPAGSIEQKIGDFYRSYLDEAAIDARGLAPVRPWLARIDALKSRHELAVLLGQLQGLADTPLSLYVDSDPKQPDINRAMAYQDGLGLPDRDYFLKDDARFAQTRAAYLEYLQALFRLDGDKRAAAHAQAVFALEKRLAQAQWPSADNRDAIKTYNPMTPAELARKAPGFDWTAFLEAAALPQVDRLIVNQPSYAIAFAHASAGVPLADWKLYLRARLLDASAGVLPQGFRQASFAFHGKAISGLQQERPRWQKATNALNAALGEAVGQIYVARHFPPEAKARMEQLVGNLLAAYRESIDGLTWMSPETKRAAQAKLAKYTTKIGYPEHWRDYGALPVRAGDAFGNRLHAGRFEYERVARRAARPVDRSEWALTPQTVNAYYNPSFNEIVFPAAILQPPFFDMAADDAVNYGAIGAIIGHEISHGFDDQGSQFDGDGKLQSWWTEADRRAFEAITAKLVEQYAGYEPLPGHKVNGQLTLGENIADLSGLQIAFKAYKLSLHGQSAPVIDGLSGEQRFFYGWSQSWRTKRREARVLQLLTMDPHSPDRFRDNGAAVNTDAFHEAFGTRPGDGMWKAPEARIRLW